MHTISILLLGFIAGQGSSILTAGPQHTAVSLCALTEQPKEYSGKIVEVKAILVSCMEFQVLRDDLCPPKVNPTSGEHDLIEVTFSEMQSDGMSTASKKLARLLKKEHQAQVTAIGSFTDPGHYFGHQDCCRYRLDIQKLISVKEVPKSSATPK